MRREERMGGDGMALILRMKDGTRCKIDGVNSVEELREKIEGKAQINGTVVDETDCGPAGIWDEDIRAVYREEVRRGGGPGGTDPVGKSKPSVMFKNRRQWRGNNPDTW